jgi:hypothetical protein
MQLEAVSSVTTCRERMMETASVSLVRIQYDLYVISIFIILMRLFLFSLNEKSLFLYTSSDNDKDTALAGDGQRGGRRRMMSGESLQF